MANPEISSQINSIAFKASIILIVLGVVSLFLPLGAPGATQEDAAEWLINDLTLYMIGWIVQIILMFSSTILFVGAAWQIVLTNPIRAAVVWLMTATTFVAFIIPKFVAVWSVPLAARSLAAGSPTRDSAEAFLLATNPSAPFGLAPTLDYLGFLFYGIMGIVLFRPLFRLSASAKIAAISLLGYGVVICLIVVAAVTAIISQGQIIEYVDWSSFIFVIAIAALLVRFRGQAKATSDPTNR